VEAYFWLNVAAAKLSPTELSEAQQQATKWFAEHPAPPCIQTSDQTKTCYPTAQDMENAINGEKKKP